MAWELISQFVDPPVELSLHYIILFIHISQHECINQHNHPLKVNVYMVYYQLSAHLHLDDSLMSAM